MSNIHTLHDITRLVELLTEKLDHRFDAEELRTIIYTHCGLAAAAGLIPVPGADIAASAANVWGMYIRINEQLNIPFSDNMVKTVGSGIAANLGSVVVVSLAVGSLLKFIPVLGTIPGAALVAATSFGVTYVAAVIYLNIILTFLEKNKNLSNVTEDDMKREAEKQMQDKDALKDMINSAKDLYKKD